MPKEKRRDLTEEEKRLTERNLQDARSRLKNLEEYHLPLCQLKLDYGWKVVYGEALSGEKNNLSKIENEINDLKFVIEVTEDQLENGVIVKGEKNGN